LVNKFTIFTFVYISKIFFDNACKFVIKILIFDLQIVNFVNFYEQTAWI